MILLSICIPTYNRAGKLHQCLTNIVCQFKDEAIKNNIEIVISDNASPDNTGEVVKSFRESFDNIRYFKNETNLGIDENIINAVLKANGKYCWHIGDDDFIQNGSLKFLVDFLSKKELALLTVDFHPFIDINKSLKEDININENLVTYHHSPEEFYRRGYCQGILSIFIFNRDLWMKVDRTDYEEFWSYYEILLKILPGSSLPLAHLNYPVIFIGQDYAWNKNGASLFTAINIKRLLNKLRNFGYSQHFIDHEIRGFAMGLPMTLLAAKTSGLQCSLRNLSIMYRGFYDYPLPLFFAITLFFIPNLLIKKVKHIKSLIKNDNQRK